MPNPTQLRSQNLGFLTNTLKMSYAEQGNVNQSSIIAYVMAEKGLSERKVKEYLKMLELTHQIERTINEHGTFLKWLGKPTERQKEVVDFGA